MQKRRQLQRFELTLKLIESKQRQPSGLAGDAQDSSQYWLQRRQTLVQLQRLMHRCRIRHSLTAHMRAAPVVPHCFPCHNCVPACALLPLQARRYACCCQQSLLRLRLQMSQTEE